MMEVKKMNNSKFFSINHHIHKQSTQVFFVPIQINTSMIRIIIKISIDNV